MERIQKSERGTFIDSEEPRITYAGFAGKVTDWKSTAFEWTLFERAVTLLKFRGGVGLVFAVATVSIESCQWEAGAIDKFESSKSTFEWKKGGVEIGCHRRDRSADRRRRNRVHKFESADNITQSADKM